MKSSTLIVVTFFVLFLLLPLISLSQSIEVHLLIGKNMDEVIKEFGKPAHQDRSNPSMECVFYKTSNHQKVFVADKAGVYQAEATKFFPNKPDAIKEINKIISSAKKKGFISDTLSITEYFLHRKGAAMDLILYENVGSQKFEIRAKARKSEYK